MSPTGSEIIEVILQAAENPRGAPADVEFVIAGVGEGRGREAGMWFLNSEANYRDFRSLNIMVAPAVVGQLLELDGIGSVEDLLGRGVRVQGQAFRVQMNFICQGRTSDAHYFQTQLPVRQIGQIELL
ncbi:MAG: hypothetical protein ACXIUM_01285 [Wenzhouxiangella sp.]